MNVLSVVDVAISIRNFVNVELHSQGWFAIRLKVPLTPGIKAVWPRSVVEAESNEMGEKPPSNQAWAIEDVGFRSRTFQIRYCYEMVEINETFIFSLYIQTPATTDFSCLVECELLFMESDPNNPSLVPAHFHLKPVSKETLRIDQVASVAHEHVPCSFSAEYFGLVNLGIISALQGYTTQDAVNNALKSSRNLVDVIFRSSPSTKRAVSGLLHRQGAAASPMSPRGGPVSPRGRASGIFDRSSMQPPQGGGSMATYDIGSLVGELHSRSLSTCLQHILASNSSPAVVSSSGLRCGPSAQISHALELESRPTPIIVKELAELYDKLIGDLQVSHKRLSAFLNNLPRPCFYPQSYAIMRKLLTGTPASVNKGGSAVAEAVNSWPKLGDSTDFMLQLPAGYTTGMAIQYLEAALHRRFREIATDWQVLLWVLRACPQDLHKFLKCNWQLDQPAIVENWLSLNMCMVDSEAQTITSANMRRRMRLERPFEVPQVHSCSFWENAPLHPIFHIDDSLAQNQSAEQSGNSDGNRPRPSYTAAMGGPGSSTPPRSGNHCSPPSTTQGGAEASPPIPHPAYNSALSASPKTPPRAHQQQRTLAALAMSDSPDTSRKTRTGIHAVVFIHGYQGNSLDLSVIKGHLVMTYPNLECFSSKSNEECTSDSLQDMGSRLAKEVAEFLKPHAGSSRCPLTALSFVAHSLGNVILRVALTSSELQPYLPMLHMYISISGPHLGFLFSTNGMLDTGMAVIKSVSSKGKCLSQLSFSDAPSVQDCFMYRLAHQTNLASFKFVLLVTSTQDRYVPHHSARLARCPAASKDSKRGPAYDAMLTRLLQDVGKPGKAQLIRIEVDFDFKNQSFSLGKIINQSLGRQAHIELILNNALGHFLAWTLQRYRILPEIDHPWV